MLQAQISKST